MSHSLLVVTYTQDLVQFTMFCHCLNRNWLGNTQLTVMLGKQTDPDLVQKIVSEQFDPSWQVKILPSQASHMQGDMEQQINKIIGTLQANTDDVIVFDSKDFLLRACDIDLFKIGQRYKHTYRLPGKLISQGYELDHLVDHPIGHLPAVSNLTPWIWNTEQLRHCWQFMIDRFGPYQQWSSFYIASEIYMYYIYVLTSNSNPLEFCQQAQTPCLFAGGWTGQTVSGMKEQAQRFAENCDAVVWKHSRKLEDPGCLDVTRGVLQQQGIDLSVIQKIYD